MARKIHQEDFIEMCKAAHGTRYVYDKTRYTKMNEKVIITCPIHGDFEQRAADHVRGCLCYSCGRSELNFNRSHEDRLKAGKKIAEKNRENGTYDRLKEKFGYEKHTVCEDGKTLSEKRFENLRKKRIENGSYISDDDRTEFQTYKLAVWRFTRKTVKCFELENIEKRGRKGGWELDHRVSIFDGFNHKIPPFIVGSIFNLMMLPKQINASKSSRSSMEPAELISVYMAAGG